MPTFMSEKGNFYESMVDHDYPGIAILKSTLITKQSTITIFYLSYGRYNGYVFNCMRLFIASLVYLCVDNIVQTVFEGFY